MYDLSPLKLDKPDAKRAAGDTNMKAADGLAIFLSVPWG